MIIRSKSPDVSIALVPWYVPIDQSRGEIGMELDRRMRECPDDTCVLIASEENTVMAMVIAYCRPNDVFLWQARAKAGFQNSSEVLNELIKWAKSKGYSKLVTKSPRAKAVARAWHFTIQNGDLVKEI